MGNCPERRSTAKPRPRMRVIEESLEDDAASSSTGVGGDVAAGALAGVVPAVVSVVLEIATFAHVPLRVATLWSAFVAGILGGLLYGGLCRMARRPVVALWAITLVIATIDSLLIATLPGASGRSPSVGIPISGLMTPFRQFRALARVGHLGTRHFPGAYLAVATMTHYITAVALLVPRWAKSRKE